VIKLKSYKREIFADRFYSNQETSQIYAPGDNFGPFITCSNPEYLDYEDYSGSLMITFLQNEKEGEYGYRGIGSQEAYNGKFLDCRTDE